MKIGMSDRHDVAEIPCKFRNDRMYGEGRACEQSEPSLPLSSRVHVFAHLLPFPRFLLLFEKLRLPKSDPIDSILNRNQGVIFLESLKWVSIVVVYSLYKIEWILFSPKCIFLFLAKSISDKCSLIIST